MADDSADAEVAEAETLAAEAKARAEAARARARAVRLRQRSESVPETEADTEAEADAEADAEVDPEADAATDTDAEADETEPRTIEAGSPRRRRWSVAAGAAAVAVICGLVGASGYITWQHHVAIAHRQRVTAFTAAAKQGVVNILALNFEHVDDDIHRLLDSSTGEFKDDFEKQAADFVAVTKKGHVISKGTVNSAAVESMGQDSAVVLVAATSYVTNSAGAKEEPRQWRLRVTVSRDGDQLKMSKLVYVP